MKAAMHSLHLCYEALSSKVSDEQRQQTLLTESTKFASQLVLLHNKDEDKWACTAKLHLFLELGQERCSPALTWNYRDEDFGGSMSRVSVRRGGQDTVWATSSGALRRFMLQHEPPKLINP